MVAILALVLLFASVFISILISLFKGNISLVVLFDCNTSLL